MKFGIYAVHDELTGFAQPTFEQSDQVAVRNFDYAINARKSMLSFRPAQYSIWKLGVYDTETGQIDECEPKMIIGAWSLCKADADSYPEEDFEGEVEE